MATAKYKSIAKHGHFNARPNGQVYEHVFVMSEMLGRPLTDLEVVHHLDEDKLNNLPKNLQLFASQAEHLTHHMHLRAMQDCGNPDYRKCPYCKAYDSPEDMMQRGDGVYYHKACNTLQAAKRKATPEGRAAHNAASAASKAKKKLLNSQ